MTTTDSNTSVYYISKLKEFKKPVILELGVNRGGSTKNFLQHITEHDGELFSVDIKDCSQIIRENKFNGLKINDWKFLQSNDLNIEYILKNFPSLKNGIDVLFIDSYHDETHVRKILEKWFLYVNKNGYIFFDDTESVLYRKTKNFGLSVNNDAIDKLIYNFYCNNINQLNYIKYFKGSGISEFKKLSVIGEKPIFSNNIWKYNYIISYIYLLVKKIIYKFKSKDKQN